MSQSIITRALFAVFCFFSFLEANAQSDEIGVGLGFMNYRGDLSNDFDMLNARPAGEIYWRHNYNPIWGYRLSGTVGRIAGNSERYNDAMSKYNELQFSAMIYEGAFTGEINFFNFRDKGNRPKVTLYTFAGIAFFYATDVPSPEEPQGGNVKFSIPFGLGLKCNLGGRTNLNFEFGPRKTFNDMLDGAHDVDPSTGIQRGFRYDNDWYYFGGISLSYIVTKIPCPYTYSGF